MSRDHARPEGKSAPDAAPPVRAPSHAERCRTLATRALSATLGTLARDPAGYPYTSLVTVAFDAQGRPLMLLSTLAEHTANLTADKRASLLVAEPLEGSREPLAIGRMTILGPCERVVESERASVREAFLAAQPSASYYVDFRDFDFFRLEPESIRYVGGFGRMSWVKGDDYRLAEPDALAPSAAGILGHMNADHADALVAYAKGLAGGGHRRRGPARRAPRVRERVHDERRRPPSDGRSRERREGEGIAGMRSIVLGARAHVEAIEVHHFRPRGDEVAHEFLVRVRAPVDLRHRAQLRVRAEDEIDA